MQQQKVAVNPRNPFDVQNNKQVQSDLMLIELMKFNSHFNNPKIMYLDVTAVEMAVERLQRMKKDEIEKFSYHLFGIFTI